MNVRTTNFQVVCIVDGPTFISKILHTIPHMSIAADKAIDMAKCEKSLLMKSNGLLIIRTHGGA